MHWTIYRSTVYLLWAAFIFGLAACGDSNPITGGGGSKPNLPMPQPSEGWAITEASDAGMKNSQTVLPIKQLAGNSFPFYVCDSVQVCHISYVEKHTGASLPLGGMLALEYEITGMEPIFVHDSANNVPQPLPCGNPPQLSLLIHRANDYGVSPAFDQYRWFSAERRALQIGKSYFAVPLTLDKWSAVYPNAGTQEGFALALSDQGSIGIGLGGGCFAAHGVAVKSGTAAMTMTSYNFTQ